MSLQYLVPGNDSLRACFVLPKPGALVSRRSFQGFDTLLHQPHLIPQFQLPDPNDRHVLAAAIHGEATVIVTENLKDFPDIVQGPGRALEKLGEGTDQKAA